MTNKAKTISFDTGLKARALFVLASDHYKRLRELELALIEMLGVGDDYGYGGHISDAIYDQSTFDLALKKAEITIAPKKVRAR